MVPTLAWASWERFKDTLQDLRQVISCASNHEPLWGRLQDKIISLVDVRNLKHILENKKRAFRVLLNVSIDMRINSGLDERLNVKATLGWDADTLTAQALND